MTAKIPNQVMSRRMRVPGSDLENEVKASAIERQVLLYLTRQIGIGIQADEIVAGLESWFLLASWDVWDDYFLASLFNRTPRQPKNRMRRRVRDGTGRADPVPPQFFCMTSAAKSIENPPVFGSCPVSFAEFVLSG